MQEKVLVKVWDVVVIGGGPAGMMAAGRAAELAKERGQEVRVLLIEKNDTLGKKLLITGGGRCNVTNAEFDTRTLLAKFKDHQQYLFSAFSQWGVKETLDFFHLKEMPTKIEAEKRVFPVSDSAQSVWNVLVEHLRATGVTVLSNSPVISLQRAGMGEKGMAKETSAITSVKVRTGKTINEIHGHSFIVATGGKSRPETGSTGDGFEWMRALGHTVVEADPALVPITLSDEWTTRLSGVSLSGVKIHVLQNGIKQNTSTGKLLFTHFGVSGPAVLNMSKDVSELLKYGEVTMSLDLLPALDYGMLNAQLQTLFREQTVNKKIKNALGELSAELPSALVPVIIELAGISPDTFCHSVTREERLKLVTLLKAVPMHVSGLLGVEKAIVTSGGVSLDEIDFKTMRSRLFSNLYLVGDMLNIDRPSGGYSLQLCWTTGFVAGTNAGSSSELVAAGK